MWSCSARCTARSFPCARRSPGYGSPMSRRRGRSSPLALGRRPGPQGTRAPRRRDRSRTVPGRRRRLRHHGRSVGPGQAAGYDAAVCAVGPGIVGTGTQFGHGALSLADAANVAVALGGRPVLTVRSSEADPRDRHRGVSHHTQSVLDLCLGEIVVAWPDEVATDGWEDACAGLPLRHMGRGPARIPPSSALRSPPESSPVEMLADGGAPPRSGRRPRDVEHVRRRREAGARGRRRRARGRHAASSTPHRCTATPSASSARRSSAPGGLRPSWRTKVWHLRRQRGPSARSRPLRWRSSVATSSVDQVHNLVGWGGSPGSTPMDGGRPESSASPTTGPRPSMSWSGDADRPLRRGPGALNPGERRSRALLPLAPELGLAVILMRPRRGGRLARGRAGRVRPAR